MEKVLFATDELTGLMHIFFLTFIAEWIISGDVANPILPVWLAIPVIFIAEWIISGDVANPILPVWLAIPVIGLLTFLCCAVTTKIISQIPGSKYIIG